MLDAFVADRQPVVESGEVEWIVNSHAGEQGVIGEVLDRQHDPFKVRCERLGQRRQGRAGDGFDLVGVRRWSEAAHGDAP